MLPESTRLPATLSDRPWAIAKPSIPAFLQRLSMRGAALQQMSLVDIEAAVRAASSVPLGRLEGSIAVIPVHGCITQKSDFYSWWYGGTSVERLTGAFRTYLNDPNVTAIVFDHDSPGGEVYGVPEFFEELFAARGKKKMVAVVNPFMASASYWLGAACDEIVMMPSGQAGSVGCYTMHQDVSAWLAKLGIAVTFVQHGEHKTEGNSFEPLSDSARAELQALVDHYGGMFDKGVAKARGLEVSEVLEQFGQGRVFRATHAKKVGMVDKIGTLDDVLASLSSKRRVGLSAAAPDAAPTVGAPASATSEEPLAAGATAKATSVCEVCGKSSCTCTAETCAADCPTCSPECPCVSQQKAAAVQHQADQDDLDIAIALSN